jgi:hypothetical protein
MSVLLTGSGGRGREISLTWMAMASHLIRGQMRPWSRDCILITLVQLQTSGQTSAASKRVLSEAKKSPVKLVYPFQGLCAWGAGLEGLVGMAANAATGFPCAATPCVTCVNARTIVLGLYGGTSSSGHTCEG